MGDFKHDYADPLVDGSEDQEVEKSEQQVVDEQEASGAMTNPELVQEETALDMAQEAGLYSGSDEEHPVEVGDQTKE